MKLSYETVKQEIASWNDFAAWWRDKRALGICKKANSVWNAVDYLSGPLAISGSSP
jgi:hypothetical protein